MRIETDKVFTRPITLGDIVDLREYLQDEYVMQYFDHGVLSDENIVKLIDMEETIYGIVLKENNKVIGHFIYHEWFMNNTYEIGWLISKKYHNKGIIFCLVSAFLVFSFRVDKDIRVIDTCQPENIASKRICEKIGMRQEGHFKKAIYIARKNEWWDELFFSILDEEYLGGKKL